MKAPTEQQLKDLGWWDENYDSSITSIVIVTDARGGINKIVGACPGQIIEIDHPDHDAKTHPRPTKPAEPDRTAPEWKDWKIAPGSWPYWMLERMHRETGRMSYDNPVKGMIRDLWRQVDRKSSAPDAIEQPPYTWRCPHCHDDNQQICDKCLSCGTAKPGAPELKGNGLPPVGTTNENSDLFIDCIHPAPTEWEIIAHRGDEAVLYQPQSGDEQAEVYLLPASEFKSQGAQRQQEETVAEAKSKLGALVHSMTGMVILNRLYDAGMLRKAGDQ